MIKPMLAYKVDKKPIDWSEKVFMQPKLRRRSLYNTVR